jgi:hypothetical protein
MAHSLLVIASRAKPGATIQLDCFIAALAMTGEGIMW